MVRVVMRMVHCNHFHSDRDPRSFTDLSLLTRTFFRSQSRAPAHPGPRVGRAGQMQLLMPRVPRPGLWLGQRSSVNPQGPHATRSLGRLHGIPRAAAAAATMLQRLAVLRQKGCHSIVVPRRRGR